MTDNSATVTPSGLLHRATVAAVAAGSALLLCLGVAHADTDNDIKADPSAVHVSAGVGAQDRASGTQGVPRHSSTQGYVRPSVKAKPGTTAFAMKNPATGIGYDCLEPWSKHCH